MSTDTEKRTVQEILERELGGLVSQAMQINEIQVAAADFIDGFTTGGEPDWPVIDYHGIPRDFFELCQKIADYEVRL